MKSENRENPNQRPTGSVPGGRAPISRRSPFAPAFANYLRRGEPQVWATAAALAGMLLLIVVLLAVVMAGGLGVFWPENIMQVELEDGGRFLGRIVRKEVNPDTGKSSIQFKTGNRELDPKRQDFRWIGEKAIRKMTAPADLCVLERVEHGDFHGYAVRLDGPDITPGAAPSGTGQSTRGAALPPDAMHTALESIRRKAAEEVGPVSGELFALSNQLHRTRDKLLRLQYRREAGGRPDLDRRIEELEETRRRIGEQSDRFARRQQQALADLRRNVVVMAGPDGRETPVPLTNIVRYYHPNSMSFAAKCRHYLSKVKELLWENPREANTEGGLFPAIFGTVMLIFMMAVLCFPLGVLAGIYLGEYAKDGSLVRLVRIAVNNLAGIPSIVYGIFGLGFFVYGIGGMIDQWFFPERVAVGTPTFGTGGILWASLTLGLLTVPVVIVSTEEAFRSIPRAVRDGSYALGATKFQTLVRVLAPMASPGMMTGFILAMARAAGEVAPLMITGVVKLAPQMPLDATFPFMHLERKFMHLGFHIYDAGFQSPNVEASKPMVYVTTLLLLAIVLAMSSAAIALRNRMRKRLLTRTI
ncbi:MAG: phosphate ABC transporter permease PstA [Pirellulaceae bacterium]|nr:phosphate ABC transporter permease PstA [Pirellulaceae bacterium]